MNPAPQTGTQSVIVIRFPSLYAKGLMAAGVIFLILGLLFASPLAAGRNVGLGLFISVLSIAAIVGGNYWRQHLHVVARMTPRELFLRRDGTVRWDEIAAIEKREVSMSYGYKRGGSTFVCIKLRTPRPPKQGLEGAMLKFKAALTGYDIIVGEAELSGGADWFIAECRKRMPQDASRP